MRQKWASWRKSFYTEIMINPNMYFLHAKNKNIFESKPKKIFLSIYKSIENSGTSLDELLIIHAQY